MSARIHTQPIKVIPFLVMVVLVFLSTATQAQNTKGDKPQSNPKKSIFHLPKLKSKTKGGDKAYTKDISGRRKLRTKNKSSAARAANPGQPRRLPYVNKRPSNDKAYAPRGGEKLKIRSKTAQASRNNVYPSYGPYINNPSKYPKDNQHAYSNRRTLAQVKSLTTKREAPGRKKVIVARTASRSYVTRGRKNVYWGKFRKGEKPVTTDITGRTIRAKNFHSPGLGVTPAHDVYKRKNKKPGDRPYSGTFTSGYVTTPKVTKAWRGDVSGHAIRSKPPKVSQSAGKMFEPRKLSNSRNRDRAGLPMRTVGLIKHSRSGKISNQPIQGKAPGYGASLIVRSLVKFRGGKRPKIYGGSSRKSFNNNGQPIQGKAPGIGGRFVDFYQGLIKTRKPFKGGGSVSKGWNNSGSPIIVKGPGIGGNYIGYKGFERKGPKSVSQNGYGFSGDLRTKRALKGGGSVSNKLWNNSGRSIGAKEPGMGGRYADTYTGGFKSRRPLKGGGSLSGKLWNNGNQPIIVKSPSGTQSKYVDGYRGFLRGRKAFNTDGSDYAGNKRIWREPKGGGSISGKLWNNRNQPIIGKSPGGIQSKYVDIYKGFQKGGRKAFNTDGSDYAGNKRIWREPKGGGSISGKLWNNSNRPLAPKIDKGSIQNKYVDIYQGFYRGHRPLKGGGSVSGKLWNNKEHPIEGKSISPSALKVGGYPGDHKVKRSEKYIHNPNSKEEALKKLKPNKSSYLVNDLLIKTKAREYEHNKLSAKGALKGESNGKNSVKAIEYSSKIKVLWTRTFEPNKPLAGRIPMRKYIHAPNSKKGALMVLAPGRAYARVKDLQVNVKMTKAHGNNLHPDSKFAYSYRDNVKHERTFLMNLKLKWAKLFKKNDTQPSAVKGKVRRPRYDPKERDLWKDLYD